MKKNKQYPIDNTKIHNKQKWVGAYVWYKNKLSRITNQMVEHPGKVCVGNLHTVDLITLRLAKVGDKVILNGELPEPHCAAITTITGFYGNDAVSTAIDRFENDRTHYSFFSKKI